MLGGTGGCGGRCRAGWSTKRPTAGGPEVNGALTQYPADPSAAPICVAADEGAIVEQVANKLRLTPEDLSRRANGAALTYLYRLVSYHALSVRCSYAEWNIRRPPWTTATTRGLDAARLGTLWTSIRHDLDMSQCSPWVLHSWQTAANAPLAGEQSAQTWLAAARLADSVLAGGRGPANPERLLEMVGVRVRVARLQARSGGRQAELSMDGDRPAVIIDPDPTPTEELTRSLVGARALESSLFRSRLAHELGHVLLHWRPASTKFQRRFEWTPQEEQFCDQFAAALLCGPVALPSSAKELVEFALDRGLDLDSVARARVAAAEDVHVAVGAYVTTRDGLRVRSSRSYGRRLNNAEAMWLHARVGVPTEDAHLARDPGTSGFVAVLSPDLREIFPTGAEVWAA